MEKTNKIESIKNFVKNNGETEIMVSVNGVDFDHIDYYADTDVAFLYSYDHPIECDIDEHLRESTLDQVLEQLG